MAPPLYIFDPVRWPHRERISRIAAMILVVTLAVIRVNQFQSYPGTFEGVERFFKGVNLRSGQILYTHAGISLLYALRLTTWGLETGILAGYLLAYASRERAVSLAAGLRETLVPVLIAGLPVLISMAPYTLARRVPYASPAHFPLSVLISGLIVLGTVVNLTALISLRRSFSIMPEARGLVTQGIYRYIRHPIYTGHMILMSGVILLRLHSYTVILFILFCWGQWFRAGMEEKKLVSAHQGYRDYRDRTGMFFPRLTGTGRTGKSGA